MMLGLASMTGCGSAKKDYGLYIYNTKSEIADSIQDLCKDYETEPGVKVKGLHAWYSGDHGDTQIRDELQNYPTLYAINQAQFTEWNEERICTSSTSVKNES